MSAKIKKNVQSNIFHIKNLKTRRQCTYEPPHQDLPCFQSLLFSSLALKTFKLSESDKRELIVKIFIELDKAKGSIYF